MIERNFILVDKRETGYALSNTKIRSSYEVKLQAQNENEPNSIWSIGNNTIELQVSKEEFAKFKIGRKYKLVLTERE